jgi:hypothetical protein
MKRAAITLALALTTLAIGCGGGDSDEDEVRATVEDFASANVDEDWAEACAQITPEAQKQLAKAGAALGGNGGCEGTLKALVTRLDEAEVKKQFQNLDVTAVKVDGDTATVKVNGETTKLVKDGDDWLLDFEPTG